MSDRDFYLEFNETQSGFKRGVAPIAVAIGDDEVGGRSLLAVGLASPAHCEMIAIPQPPTASPPRKDLSRPPTMTMTSTLHMETNRRDLQAETFLESIDDPSVRALVRWFLVETLMEFRERRPSQPLDLEFIARIAYRAFKDVNRARRFLENPIGDFDSA
jgi:hypothetical protein